MILLITLALEAGINIPRMTLRWGGVRVLLPCLIFFYNLINLPADPCRSMYPAIFWHIFYYYLLQSCWSACVLPGYDTTTSIHSHIHPHVTLIHHILHTSLDHLHAPNTTTWPYLQRKTKSFHEKKKSLTEGIDTSKLHSSRRHYLLNCDCIWMTSLGDMDNCIRTSTAVIYTAASDIENMSLVGDMHNRNIGMYSVH